MTPALARRVGRAFARYAVRARHPSITICMALLSLAHSAAAESAPSEQPLAHPLGTESAYGEQPLALRLTPTPEELHRSRTTALELRLRTLLTALPDVEAAEVQLLLPAPFAEPLDAPLPPPRATVVLTRREGQPPSVGDDVARIVRGSVSALTREHLTLIERTQGTPERKPALVAVGPFLVDVGSARSLRVWLAISLLANALLAGVVLSRLRQKSPVPPKVDRAARTLIPP